MSSRAAGRGKALTNRKAKTKRAKVALPEALKI